MLHACSFTKPSLPHLAVEAAMVHFGSLPGHRTNPHIAAHRHTNHLQQPLVTSSSHVLSSTHICYSTHARAQPDSYSLPCTTMRTRTFCMAAQECSKSAHTQRECVVTRQLQQRGNRCQCIPCQCVWEEHMHSGHITHIVRRVPAAVGLMMVSAVCQHAEKSCPVPTVQHQTP